MKTKIFWAFLTICLLGMNNSIAQTFDQIIIGNNNGQTFVIPDLPDDAEYRIGVENGGLFPIELANYIPGTLYWGSICDDSFVDFLDPHCGSGKYSVLYEKNDNISYRLDMWIHYFISTESSILEANSGSWTAVADDWLDEKTLQLPSGINSLTMNVVNEVAGNFLEFIWYFEKEDLSLHEIAIIQNNEPVNINLNDKDQIKILIKAYDSPSSAYRSEDYFIIKSSGPKIYDVSGSSYCEGSSGTVDLNMSESGVEYQLYEGETAIQAPKNGDGSVMTWTGISAGSYIIKARKGTMTATMNGIAEVVMNPLPTKPVISADKFVEKGETVLYSTNASYADSYTWTISSSELATISPNGATANITFNQAGSLTITTKAKNGCSHDGVSSDGFVVRVVDLSGNDCSELENQVLALQGQVATLTTENQNLTSANEALQLQVSDLTSTNEALQLQVSDLTSENEGLQLQVVSLQGQVSDLTSENEDLQGQVADLTSENENLQEQVADLTSENEDLQEQVADLTSENEALEAQLAQLSQRISEIANLLDVDEEEIEDMIEILLEVYVIEFDSYNVTTHIVETEIGTFTFNAYPNPNPGELFISCTEIITDLQIYSISGQLITQKTVNDTETSLIMSRNLFNPGTYIIKIVLQNGGSLTQKVIFSPK